MKSLHFQDVSVNFGRIRALDHVSTSVAGGEVLLLAGPNGAGKSTLIRVLLGLVRPSAGNLLVDSKPTHVDNALKRRIGYLPEAVAFGDNLTGLQVMRFFAMARGVSMERARSVLHLVGLEQASGRAVRGYSRGMRQRLGLGVAILGEPELLVLDEPTGGLDQEGLTVLWRILEEWQRHERCVVVASHDLTMLERRVDRVCLLKRGKVLSCETPTRLREHAALPVTVHFRSSGELHSETLAHRIEQRDLGEVTKIDADRVCVRVKPDRLLRLLDVRQEFPQALDTVRVEEPGLDMIYEHLLQEQTG